MGIFGASLLPSSAFVLGKRPPAQPEQTPAYKPPGTARSIVGGIGDALQQWAGGHATFAPAIAEQRRAAMEAQQAQLQRAQEFGDFTRKFDYQAAHRPPPAPTALERNYEFLNGMNPDLGDRYVQSQADPTVSIPLPDGRVYIGPRSGLQSALGGAGSSQPPTAPVGKLTPIHGGASPTGSRTFPLR